MSNQASRIEQLEAELAEVRQSLEQRFNELAALTRLLENSEQENHRLRVQLNKIQLALSTEELPEAPPANAPLSPATAQPASPEQADELVELVQQSALFNASWYLEQYPDVAAANIHPAEHYVHFGGMEGRDPGPEFNSSFYLQQNEDVRQNNMNPLVHYLLFGQHEHRAIKPE
ncbi:hypothetical protein [Oceanimonas smirnovii]|uniref:hypothetical protein n=1 Tax=Oceanimonas smirnovii TaxID=264574 RepID=UPI00036370C0|nr:hypothetical protein [Oceanimonas smirnovii]